VYVRPPPCRNFDQALERQPDIDAAVFGASSIAIVRTGEKPVVAARRGVWMVVTITCGRIVSAAIVAMLIAVIIAVIIAVFVGAHGAVIIRVILGTDNGRRQSGHGEGREGK
jgi:hypothetical protein